MSERRLFLIDGSGYLYRAFYGIRNLSRRDGFPTNAIFGFIKMARKVMDDHAPDYLAMVFDARGPTFRHELFGDYKANRKSMPEELAVQLPIIHDLVAAFNIPLVQKPGFEADDLIGTLARQGAEAGMAVTIVSGDKDLMQMIRPGIEMFDPGKEKRIGVAEATEHWGVEPGRIIEVMGLSGDASDNIPGVAGIGPKTAAQLINQFGDLETLLARTDQVKQPKRRQSLQEHAELARLSKRLATIDQEAPLDGLRVEDLRVQPPDRAQLRQIFLDMEFHSLVAELGRSEAPSETGEGIGEATGTEEPTENAYHAVTNASAFAAFLEQLQTQPAFSLDTETTDLDATRAELVGLSFAWRAREAWYLPVAHQPDAAPDGQLDRAATLAALKPILEDPNIAKTGQNLKYEYLIFRRYDITLAGIDRDAMLQSHLLHGPARRHNLDAIALEVLGRTTITFKEVAGTGKKALRFDQVPLERAVPYACEDAEVAWAAAEAMTPLLARQPETERLCREIELPLIPVLGEMERAGALIDRNALERMSEDFSRRRARLTEEIHQLAGEAFNVNSTQQLGHILFSPDKLGVKGGKRTKTGFSTDVSVLTKLADQGHELPAKVLEYRGLTKLQSTYTDALVGLIDPADGRVHTSYNQAVTLTGRLSSSDPNLQNIPIRTEEGRAIRRAFIAPPGAVLLSADYSQIELRLLAHMGPVPRLREAFAEGRDIHAATAEELFGALILDEDEKRRMAKTINFGLIYGMSAYGLAKRLGVSNFEARDYMDLYFARYQGVRDYMGRVVEQARGQGFVATLGGRRCPIRDIGASSRTLREFAERTAINAPIQGSAADLIKMAMIRLARSLAEKKFRARMILQVHDELVLEVPEDELTAIQPLVRAAMEEAMTLSVPLQVDIGWGANWGEAH